jgi:hypothetical protein
VADKKEALAQSLFDHIPVGVGSQGIIPTTAADLEASLEMGMDWSLREVACHAQASLQCNAFQISQDGVDIAQGTAAIWEHHAQPHSALPLCICSLCLRSKGCLLALLPHEIV